MYAVLSKRGERESEKDGGGKGVRNGGMEDKNRSGEHLWTFVFLTHPGKLNSSHYTFVLLVTQAKD